jgi:class 3 adenylate cyclase/predicted ATPase/ABC-type transport system involved in cytochrome c biogenesis ATPase subunit
MDIGGWLRGLGLERYEQAFRDNEIDLRVLPELTADDLKELGVAAIGHRRLLLKAIADLAVGAGRASAKDARAAPPADAAADAERRQLTVMFCDLVGSTPLSTRFDPEDLRGIIGAYHRCVTEIVEGFGGFVARYMGDGVLVYFGYPRAHEDDAERATRCGLALVDRVPQLGQGEELEARVGIATGLVVVGGEVVEHDVAGETPNLAARLQALAEPGQIVIAGATRRLIGDLFRLTDLGPQTAKGFTQPVEGFAVEGVAVTESRFEAARRGLTDLVGRAAETALLRERLREAWAGAGQIVLLSGEAGIGKSRLGAHLLAEVADEPHTRLRYQCSPYHRDSVLHPFVVALGRAAHLAAEDPAETQLEKLEALLAPARIAETAPLFASLLSIPTGGRYPPLTLSAAQQRRLTLAALLDQLEALARQKPVLMLFEDVHWADASSLEVLDLTVERVRALPVLALLTFRPEYEAPWTGLSHVTSIALDRLAPAEVETLAEHVAGRPLPPGVTAQIVAKTDGVPLFVEELTKTVLEAGLLVAGPQGWHLDGPLPPFAIPATLQDSLAARLDRLASVKEIAQIGAAIGREFAYPLLRAVAGRDEPALRAALAQLEEAELLFRSGMPPDARYTFKHALVQDTAYETLLKSRRQILHRQIADALRGEFAAVAIAEPELVAHHLTQAGLDEPAIEWWGKAGDQALRRSAFKEAAAHLGKAIELADKLAATARNTAPGIDRLRLQTSLGNALIWVRGFEAPETSAAFARARELASREEDASERFSAYYGLWVGHMNRCEPAPLREMAELFLREATARPNCPEAVVAHRISGSTCFYFGDFAGARDHFQKTVELYDQTRHGDFANRFGNDPRAAAEAYDALALWGLGRVDEALRLGERALADAESAAHAPTTAYALMFAALLGLVRCNPEAVATCSQALADIVSRYDLPAWWAGWATFLQGWAKRSEAAEESRLAEMRRSLAIVRERGQVWLLPRFEAALAEAEASAGETEAGLRRLGDTLAELERSEQHWYEAEIHRIRGEILLKRDPANTAAAEQSLQAAIAIAQSQKARSFELRAALSLAKLYRAANRDTDAHAALAPAVEGFPPTQQFPELTEAQSLLAALAQSDAVKSAAALRQQRVRLQISLGNALMWAKGYHAPETIAAFARAREMASREEDASDRFSAYYGLWSGHGIRGEPEPMREMAELFLREATVRPNCPETLMAHRISGLTRFYFGDFAGAHDHYQRSLELYDPVRHSDFVNRFGQDPRASAEIFDALTLWVLGRIDEALPLADRALADAESAAHSPTMGVVLVIAALLGLVRCNQEAVATYGQALADIVSRYDLPVFIAGRAVFFQGWAKWSDGAEESGLAEMGRGLAIFRDQGRGWFLPSLEAALAEAEARAGETDAGLRRLDDALADLGATEARCYEAELHRTRAGILLQRDPADAAAAEQSLQAAIAIAQSQKARSFELRAALSLAKLYRAANRDADAHTVLAPAVEGFPPTQQFPELAEAQTLLAALST